MSVEDFFKQQVVATDSTKTLLAKENRELTSQVEASQTNTVSTMITNTLSNKKLDLGALTSGISFFDKLSGVTGLTSLVSSFLPNLGSLGVTSIPLTFKIGNLTFDIGAVSSLFAQQESSINTLIDNVSSTELDDKIAPYPTDLVSYDSYGEAVVQSLQQGKEAIVTNQLKEKQIFKFSNKYYYVQPGKSMVTLFVENRRRKQAGEELIFPRGGIKSRKIDGVPVIDSRVSAETLTKSQQANVTESKEQESIRKQLESDILNRRYIDVSSAEVDIRYLNSQVYPNIKYKTSTAGDYYRIQRL